MPDETSAPFGEEYVTDVPYSRTFVHQLAPTMMRLVAAVNGVPSPNGEDFDYCELGSANGDTLVTLAAANPNARFVGVDINPEHVAFANALAARSGLTNVRFLERDFEGLQHDQDLPPFDFIGAHGMVSWVAPAKRKALLEFAKAKLKPGGLLYVSYNALPGWSGIEPLRRLLLDHAGPSESNLERAREGTSFARRLSQAGAAYFANHPNAKAMLAIIEKAGLSYVAHEYLNAHWEPMYFADLAKEMAAHDLGYVGQLPLYLNVPDLAMPRALKELGMSLGDRIAFDSLKDFAVNELLRSDVYVKGSVERAEPSMRAYFENTVFGTTATVSQIKRSVRLPIYTLEFTGPIYDAIVSSLTQAAASATELAAQPKLASFGAKRIGDCLMNLALGGQVWPMRRRLPTAIEGTRYRIALAHNRAVLQQFLSDDPTPLVLASPVTGTGMTLSMLEALRLHLITDVAPADRPAFIKSFAKERKTPISVGGRPIVPEKLVRLVLREVDAFDAPMATKAVEIGILEPHGASSAS